MKFLINWALAFALLTVLSTSGLGIGSWQYWAAAGIFAVALILNEVMDS